MPMGSRARPSRIQRPGPHRGLGPSVRTFAKIGSEPDKADAPPLSRAYARALGSELSELPPLRPAARSTRHPRLDRGPAFFSTRGSPGSSQPAPPLPDLCLRVLLLYGTARARTWARRGG